MPIDTTAYKIQSLAKMIRPKANTISVPKHESRALIKVKVKDLNRKYIVNNMEGLKDHFRKLHTTKVKVAREDERLPLERFD